MSLLHYSTRYGNTTWRKQTRTRKGRILLSGDSTHIKINTIEETVIRLAGYTAKQNIYNSFKIFNQPSLRVPFNVLQIYYGKYTHTFFSILQPSLLKSKAKETGTQTHSVIFLHIVQTIFSHDVKFSISAVLPLTSRGRNHMTAII